MGFGTHSAFYSVGTSVLSWGQSVWGLTLTTHLNLLPRLRMSGAVHLIPIFSFMAWRGKFYIYFYPFVERPASNHLSCCMAQTLIISPLFLSGWLSRRKWVFQDCYVVPTLCKLLSITRRICRHSMRGCKFGNLTAGFVSLWYSLFVS
jgi:hypothetical protein